MSRDSGYMCTKRLNGVINSKEIACDLKFSAHIFGTDLNDRKMMCSDIAINQNER